MLTHFSVRRASNVTGVPIQRRLQRRGLGLRTALIAIISMCATLASAVPIVINPLGLNLGSQYRLVFVTSQSRDATATNIADYNTFVNSVANSQPLLAALGTTWTALVSTETIDAQDNTNSNPTVVLGAVTNPGLPVYRLDGLRVADNNLDLWYGGFPEHTISITELGGTTPITNHTTSVERPWVWTGSVSTGVRSGVAFAGSNIVNAGLAYDSLFFNPDEWIGLAFSNNTDKSPFYAISGVLTVGPPSTVPAPTCLGLLVPTILGLALLQRARRRRR